MAVNGILLGQNTGSNDSAPLIFNLSEVNNTSGVANVFNAVGKQEKPNAILWNSELNLICYITKYTNSYIEFVGTDSFEGNRFVYYASTGDDKFFLAKTNFLTTIDSTIKLLSTDWTINEKLYIQTVTVPDIKSKSFETYQQIYITPKIDSMTAYMESGVYASDQDTNQITFTAFKKPTSDLSIYVLIKNL